MAALMWAVVLLGAAGCFALRLSGYLLPQSLLDRPVVNRVTALVPIALLTALVVVLTFGGSPGTFTVDARLAGVLAAALLLLARAPFFVVVAGAAAVAAALRAFAG